MRADASKTVRQAATFDSSVSELPGLRIVETYTDNNHSESYALACLDTVHASHVVKLGLDQVATGIAGGASYGDLMSYRQRLGQLGDLGRVLGVWLSESVVLRLEEVKVMLDTSLKTTKAQQTFMLSSPISSFVAAAVSSALTQKGYVASGKQPRYIVVVEESAIKDSLDIGLGLYILRQDISLTFQDTVNEQAKTSQVFCKGLGAQFNQAKAKLQAQCSFELGKAIETLALQRAGM